jgi:hypothetical protein
MNTNTPSDRRIVIGLVVQPLLAFGLGAAIAAVRVSTTDAVPMSGSVAHAMISSGLVLAIATVAGCVVALPVIIWLRGRGQVTFGRAALVGTVLGNIPIALLYLLARAAGDARALSSPWVSWLEPVFLASFIGFTCAGAFWFMATAGMPRSEAKPSA